MLRNLLTKLRGSDTPADARQAIRRAAIGTVERLEERRLLAVQLTAHIASVDPVPEGGTIHLDGTKSFSTKISSLNLSYLWNFPGEVDDQGKPVFTERGPTPTLNAGNGPGTVVVRLRVRHTDPDTQQVVESNQNSKGITVYNVAPTIDSVSVTSSDAGYDVTPGPASNAADGSAITIVEGNNVELTTVATDPGGDDVTITTELLSLDLTSVIESGGNGASFSPGEGSYKVRVTASDGIDSSSRLYDLHVLNAPPVLDADPDNKSVNLSAGNPAGSSTSPRTVKVTLNISDSESDLAEGFSYSIDWGDGSAVQTGTNVFDGHVLQYTYASPQTIDGSWTLQGSHWVKTINIVVFVTDVDGADSDPFEIEIELKQKA